MGKVCIIALPLNVAVLTFWGQKWLHFIEWLTDAFRISNRGCRLQLYVSSCSKSSPCSTPRMSRDHYSSKVTCSLLLQGHVFTAPASIWKEDSLWRLHWQTLRDSSSLTLLIRTILEVSGWGPGRGEVKLNIFQIRGLHCDMLTSICFRFHVQLNGHSHNKGTYSFVYR
jgi:hypothetical protein